MLDHRIAMTAAVAGAAGSGVHILNADCACGNTRDGLCPAAVVSVLQIGARRTQHVDNSGTRLVNADISDVHILNADCASVSYPDFYGEVIGD